MTTTHPPLTPHQPFPQEWWEIAACKGLDTNLFHPTHGHNEQVRAAKAICATCPVRSECLNDAMTTEARGTPVVGVWGGLAARERQVLAGRRRARR